MTPIPFSNRAQQIKPSPTLAVANRATELQAAGQDIINLGVGEPDFDTPTHIKNAAKIALDQGKTKYTAVDGIPNLKLAICNKFKHDNQLDYAPKQVLVTCGGKQAIYNLMQATLNDADEVIIPAPYWVSYPDITLLAGAKPVYIATDIATRFKITATQLATAITPKTRLLILNSPSNPSGMSYTQQELSALGEVLRQHPQVMILTDDMYEHIRFHAGPFVNILNVCPDLYERTFVVNAVSKAYAMTGWRIGFIAGPANIILAMKNIQSQSTSNPCSIAQYAALAALDGPQTCVTDMTAEFKKRHDFLVGALNDIPGIQCLPSDGTFYCFPRIDGLYHLLPANSPKNDLAFADFLLDQAGLAVVPGSAFGTANYLRLSFATSYAVLEQTIERLRKIVG